MKYENATAIIHLKGKNKILEEDWHFLEYHLQKAGLILKGKYVFSKKSFWEIKSHKI